MFPAASQLRGGGGCTEQCIIVNIGHCGLLEVEDEPHHCIVPDMNLAPQAPPPIFPVCVRGIKAKCPQDTQSLILSR